MQQSTTHVSAATLRNASNVGELMTARFVAENPEFGAAFAEQEVYRADRKRRGLVCSKCTTAIRSKYGERLCSKCDPSLERNLV